jgi:hypothetical protein
VSESLETAPGSVQVEKDLTVPRAGRLLELVSDHEQGGLTELAAKERHVQGKVIASEARRDRDVRNVVVRRVPRIRE